MAACLPNAEQRKPSLRFSLRLAVFVKKIAPVRARVCAVIVEDSHRRKGTSATPCTAVSNYFTESRTNKFPFMDRLSWRPLSFQTKRAMSACGVRREKAALSSGCKPHPATAPAGSNRSSHGGNEVAEAFD